MFLHLGHKTIVNGREVLGVFDIDTTSVSAKTREFMARAQREDRVVNVSSELPKSFVLAQKGKEAATLYISQMAPATLKKRWDNPLGEIPK